MKNKKGFTLIELLAIIVILAIIAVITVPIILNIIENSKMGAATDSAYGFKDAVNKAYVTKLSGDSDYSIADDTYTVEDLKTQIGLSLSGKEPGSNSWVTIEKNNVAEGCLQYDEFKVEFTDGKVSNTEKGECEALEQIPTIPSCPGCVYAYVYVTYGQPQQPLKYGPNGTGDILNEYTRDYTTLNKNHFLGFILDGNQKIERAFACGINENDGTPFCIEGTTDGSKYLDNVAVINGLSYCSSGCTEKSSYNGSYVDFGAPPNMGGENQIGGATYNDGWAYTYVSANPYQSRNGFRCDVVNSGYASCQVNT